MFLRLPPHIFYSLTLTLSNLHYHLKRRWRNRRVSWKLQTQMQIMRHRWILILNHSMTVVTYHVTDKRRCGVNIRCMMSLINCHILITTYSKYLWNYSQHQFYINKYVNFKIKNHVSMTSITNRSSKLDTSERSLRLNLIYTNI